MRQFRFIARTPVRIRGIAYELVNPFELDGKEHWSVKLRASGVYEQFRREELEELYNKGDLIAEPDQSTPASKGSLRKRARLNTSELPENQRKRIAFRKGVLRGVGDYRNGRIAGIACPQDATANSKERLASRLRELGNSLGVEHYGGPRKVSVATYYRWRAKYEAREDDRDLGREGGGDTKPKYAVARKIAQASIARILEDAQHKPLGSKPRYTMRDVMRAVVDAIEEQRRRSPGIPMPKRPTVYRYHKAFPAHLRELAAHGPIKARAMLRSPPTADAEPLNPLDFVQFDETRLPLMVIDEILGIALGRPWLAWLVDVYTRGILGFYIGFEPPGDVVISSTFRHAFLFKSYIKNEYPDINGEWLHSGISRFVTFDNSLQAHGRTIDTLCSDLDILWDYQPARYPWLKSEVEGSFATINQLLLKELPGNVPNIGTGPHINDYDPREHARIGLRHLLWIFHHFVVNNLHTRTPEGLAGLPSNVLWKEGIKNAPPGYIDQAIDLDVLFGIVRPGRRLDHRGVFFEDIFYYGEGAEVLRRQRGSSTHCTLKVIPARLDRVYVKDEFEGGWYPLQAHPKHRDYAARVSLHTHRLYQSHSRRLYDRNDIEACVAAERDLHRLIREAPEAALTIRNMTVLARSMGLGTHSLFDGLDHSGKLNISSGPHAGMPLSPLRLPAVQPMEPHNWPADSVPAAKPRREIPIFRTDRTLGRSQ